MTDKLPETLDDLYAPRAIVVNRVTPNPKKKGRGYKPIINHRDAALSEADRQFGDEIAANNRSHHAAARDAIIKRK